MIEIENVSKTFGKGDAAVRALCGVNVHIKNNEMVAVMGKSGSGKSTLLNIMGALTSFDEGSYRFNGNEVDSCNRSSILRFRRDHIGFIVQYFALIEDMTVFENVALPLKYQKMPSKEINGKVAKTLDKFGIYDKRKAYPNELSGGQQQRVGIARALVKEPDVLLADEPTGALDEQTEIEVMEIFKGLHAEGKTIVIVTHDMNVAKYCSRAITLRDGCIE